MNWADKLKDQVSAVRQNRADSGRVDSTLRLFRGSRTTEWYPVEVWFARATQPRTAVVAPSWNRVTKLRLRPDRF